ncbi:hypothetical protein ACJIZ3_002259 [Penstemon smallii]|uniref:Uncharacterized protein n=1 Tax=Penstemon smallii TaxID=265156 RepID=A0ABD3U7F7_9LAMI
MKTTVEKIPIPNPNPNPPHFPQGLRKGTWTKEEDILLRKCIEKYGEGNWHQVPVRAGLNRCRKSCRLRWYNYLSPNINRNHFTKEEVDLIIRLHKLLGNRWSLIAGRLPGRTGNDVKNFWNTHINNKKTKVMITKSNIIRPQPRTFKKLLYTTTPNHQPMENNHSTQKELKNHNINQSSTTSSPLSLQPLDVDVDVDECILWWRNLLDFTEISDQGITGIAHAL